MVFISQGRTAPPKKISHIGDRLCQHVAAAAEQFQECRPEDKHAQHERQPEADADQQRMRGERRGAIDISGTECPRDRGCHAATHRPARHGHGQNHAGKHQRHRSQRLDAEPADVGCLGDHHTGACAKRNHVGPCKPYQRAQDRAIEQCILRRRLRWRKRTLLFVYGYLSDGDVGQFGFSPRARSKCRAATFLTPIKPDTMRAGRMGRLRD
jgi:hypothetical protein